jgi:PKD repeat protein
MNKAIFSLICATLLVLGTNPLRAQNITPDWAKQIYGLNGLGGSTDKGIAIDKEGNIYALYYELGIVYADGNATQDSTSTSVLTSWDCDGNLRWVKSFGATGNTITFNFGTHVETDTLGGVYISGYAFSVQTAGSVYWDTDTSMNIAPDRRIEFVVKYNTQGQFQWLRTPVDSSSASTLQTGLSVSPSGEVFWFSLLDTGVYGGGDFTINTRKYYAVKYDAAGGFQAAIPFDMTPPVPMALGGASWDFDPATNRFYGRLHYDTAYGSLVIGNITVVPPTGSSSGTAVLAAFDKQGQNLWVRQGSTAKTSAIANIAFGNDGALYLLGRSEPGNVFCGDTTLNSSGLYYPMFIMALDTNANRLWSKYSANSFANAYDISQVNNTVTIIGTYYDTLGWDGYTVINPGQYPPYGYMLQADAATGTAVQLTSINATGPFSPTNTALDKNGNLYISGSFRGNLVFGNSNLSSYPNSIADNSFLLKYKNVVCNCDLLQPAFNFSNSAATTFQFTYAGQTPYASISWDFGDGATVTGVTSPSHTYAAAGTYPVCVTVTNGCGSNTSCKYVSFTTGIKDAGGAFSSVSIYPNPAQDQLTITSLPQGTTVEVLDMTGRLLKRVQSGNAELQIDVEGLSAGIHLLRFTDRDGMRGSSIFVKR